MTRTAFGRGIRPVTRSIAFDGATRSPTNQRRVRIESSRRIREPHSTGDRGLATASLELDDFEEFLLDLQSCIVRDTESIDGSDQRFCRDRWERDVGSGFGITQVLEGGSILERGAVNISIIRGRLSSERAKAISSRGRDIDPQGNQPYSAAALSLVFHSRHPYIPTLRADVRRFTVEGLTWFGGGADLTPSYLFEQDAQEFHLFWKRICDKRSAELYPRFKSDCDAYFYLPSRSEHRGIGGIFFDDLDQSELDYDVQSFVQDVGIHLLPSWTPIVGRRRSVPYGERHWQLLRRGRYIEFNLLYDRGIRFGLQGGRIESIMVSAPPLVAWSYDVDPSPQSREEFLINVLKSPVDWTFGLE